MTRRVDTGADDAGQLAGELARLHRLGLGSTLREVRWRPRQREGVEAEVLGEEVRVYVEDFETALRALRHEVLHFEIARCSLPYVEILNELLARVNEEAYRRKERLAERLAALLERR